VVFKRRDRRPILQTLTAIFYPRGGWVRAIEYWKHRVRRLPDTPEKISRGIWAGVFVSFSPFFGLHFLMAVIMGRIMRGNLLAALTGTFIANPLTYLPIAATSLGVGHFLLGTRPTQGAVVSLGEKFSDAGADLWHNIKAIFTQERMDWHGLAVFFDEVFYPYMIGGLVPGVVVATVCYYLSVPVIAAYQNRRRKRLRAKLDQLRNSADQGDNKG